MPQDSWRVVEARILGADRSTRPDRVLIQLSSSARPEDLRPRSWRDHPHAGERTHGLAQLVVVRAAHRCRRMRIAGAEEEDVHELQIELGAEMSRRWRVKTETQASFQRPCRDRQRETSRASAWLFRWSTEEVSTSPGRGDERARPESAPRSSASSFR